MGYMGGLMGWGDRVVYLVCSSFWVVEPYWFCFAQIQITTI